MRISREALERGLVWSTVAGLIVYAILLSLDLRLKALTGVSVSDLESLGSAVEYRLAFHAWAPEAYAARAGFNLGFAYLLMPLYAVSFFLSGVLVAERFTPGRHRLRRWVLLAAMVAPVAALLDAGGKALQFTMLLLGPDDSFARICSSLGSAKNVAVTVGVALLLGALVVRFERRKAKK
jgi:hypothetical protein